MKCKVNNNITNFYKTEQAEVSIANGLSCDVNDKKAKAYKFLKTKIEIKSNKVINSSQIEQYSPEND